MPVAGSAGIACRCRHVRENRLGLRHSPGSAPFTSGKHPFFGGENAVAELFFEMPDIFGCLPVRPHGVIHCGHDEHRRLCGKQYGSEKIAGLSRGGTRDEVRGGRGNDDRLGFACELDVIEGASGVE